MPCPHLMGKRFKRQMMGVSGAACCIGIKLRENIPFQRVVPCRQGLKTPALRVAGFKTPPMTRVCERGFKPRNQGDRDFESLADGDLHAMNRFERTKISQIA